MSLADELLRQVGDDPFGPTVIFGRHTFEKRRDLGNLHSPFPFVVASGYECSLSEQSLWIWRLPKTVVCVLQHRQSLCQPTCQYAQGLRSEEHTSELQSQSNLVCRL